jgi:hypothetical protein
VAANLYAWYTSAGFSAMIVATPLPLLSLVPGPRASNRSRIMRRRSRASTNNTP